MLSKMYTSYDFTLISLTIVWNSPPRALQSLSIVFVLPSIFRKLNHKQYKDALIIARNTQMIYTLFITILPFKTMTQDNAV